MCGMDKHYQDSYVTDPTGFEGTVYTVRVWGRRLYAGMAAATKNAFHGKGLLLLSGGTF